MSFNYNTTYNIKQPNFGQALLGGLMQSLGMGGGCCDFGGGMNSIFSMGGFGMPGGFGCGGYTDYNSSAGVAVANAITGVLGQAINCYWGGGGGSTSSANLTKEQQIAKLDSEIKSLETKAKSPEKEIGTKYDADIKSATTNRDKWESNKSKLQDRLNTLQAKSAEELTATEKKELETLQGTGSGSVAYANEQYEKYQKELQEANEAKDKAIADKKAELEKQIEDKKAEKAKLEKEVNNNLLDEADGHRYQQLKSVDYDALFDKDNKLIPSSKVTAKAVRAAIQRYKDASINDKDKYKTQLQQLWAELPDKEKNSTLESAYDLICG